MWLPDIALRALLGAQDAWFGWAVFRGGARAVDQSATQSFSRRFKRRSCV